MYSRAELITLFPRPEEYCREEMATWGADEIACTEEVQAIDLWQLTDGQAAEVATNCLYWLPTEWQRYIVPSLLYFLTIAFKRGEFPSSGGIVLDALATALSNPQHTVWTLADDPHWSRSQVQALLRLAGDCDYAMPATIADFVDMEGWASFTDNIVRLDNQLNLG